MKKRDAKRVWREGSIAVAGTDDLLERNHILQQALMLEAGIWGADYDLDDPGGKPMCVCQHATNVANAGAEMVSALEDENADLKKRLDDLDKLLRARFGVGETRDARVTQNTTK